MLFFIVIWIILLFLYSIFLLIKYFWFIRKTKNVNLSNNEKLNENQGIFIAIPCLREQSCIKETVDYFRSITDLPIIIITTEKESYEYNYDTNVITTKQIVEKEIIPKYRDVFLIHYPYIKGYMADQLNYLLNNLNSVKGLQNNKDWYMALYNADSKPSKQTFQHIKKAINDGHIVIQQYSYCMKNYDQLNCIMKGFSLYQSNFEIKTGLFNSYLNLCYLYNYVVGHGLIINISLLKKIGNFNTVFWCEDIYLTMNLKFNKIKIKPILQLENIENANTLKQVIKQNSVWFNTTKKYYKIYSDIKAKRGQSTFNGLIGCINEFRCAINWLCFPILLTIILFLSIINKNIIFICSILLTYSFYIYCNYFITIKTINLLEKEKYKINLKGYFSLFLSTFISNFGPIYSLINKSNEKYKTER